MWIQQDSNESCQYIEENLIYKHAERADVSACINPG